ncbi:hypothetical protein ACFQFC_15640 [Amorphoplanes digitatis]|uniref:Uncharacterized protein n=1 Tax=Actinoplanes digitatis TaxID=1868 RepID=A0A7W7I3E1_9ACTN|nr:hypothetical protein [Actinoplanes digitatis]MBB4765647.1 hypothetical protein [Actinoplanes digitatis]GID98307.1 hypothetical protein Adi01nite_77190 [Actinoplanes digitatis]
MSILIMSSIIGAFFGAVAAEFLDISAWLAPRIVRRAARNFSSPELSARYEEEWLSELAHYDGLKMIKLVKSIALLAGSYRTAAIYRGEYFIGIGIYTSRLRALVPMLIRYVWRGEGPLSATIILEFAFTRLIDENPELTVSRLMDGSGVGHIHVSTDYSWAVAALHRVIKRCLKPPLNAVHNLRSRGKDPLASSGVPRSEISIEWLIDNCKAINLPPDLVEEVKRRRKKM